MILPQAGRHPEAFYDAATGGLRPEYAWYLQGMERLRQPAGQITVQGESVVLQLKEQTRPAP